MPGIGISTGARNLIDAGDGSSFPFAAHPAPCTHYDKKINQGKHHTQASPALARHTADVLSATLRDSTSTNHNPPHHPEQTHRGTPGGPPEPLRQLLKQPPSPVGCRPWALGAGHQARRSTGHPPPSTASTQTASTASTASTTFSLVMGPSPMSRSYTARFTAQVRVRRACRWDLMLCLSGLRLSSPDLGLLFLLWRGRSWPRLGVCGRPSCSGKDVRVPRSHGCWGSATKACGGGNGCGRQAALMLCAGARPTAGRQAEPRPRRACADRAGAGRPGAWLRG